MDVHDVKLTISAVAAAQYPEDGRPEIAFLGRSNVGKSSLINKLIKRKAMARTSSVPGKTQTLNFYDLDSRLFFVDVPVMGMPRSQISPGKVCSDDRDLSYNAATITWGCLAGG